MKQLIVIAHNLRSAHNVGSLLRTADGFGVHKVYLSGYTPYPVVPGDSRLPHVAHKQTTMIAKTSLGAETTMDIEHVSELEPLLAHLRQVGYDLYALEQDDRAIALPDFHAPQQLALIVGREVEGIEASILSLCDGIVEIPMLGKKESFNVVQAAAVALYHCQFVSA